ncbi:MAG: SpoIIE family protein phosphatase [Candidatus Eremiobacteraeota bacterium]|nr:SpoIIE family protein phosphatase [Candidatus Eremiobacteraeota bacterium]
MSDTVEPVVLVVDDTETNVDILLELLGDEYDVRVAMDGLSAMEQIAHQAPDLVLLDIMMPGMSGIEVLEKLKNDLHLRHIPVIMISAVDEMKTVVHCIEHGAEDYLQKPFEPVLLRARIRASLEKKRFHDAEQDYLRTIMETQEILNDDLKEAAEYVRSLLPEPLSGSVAARWRFIPSTHLGGDAFGYYWLDDEHFVIFLLDVCGHGVGAALLSISIMNVIRSGSLPGTDFTDPSAVLDALNKRFQMDTQHDKYFTAWYGVYHSKTGLLTYGNAGHPPPVLFNGPSEKEALVHKLRAPGQPIGWELESVYENDSCQCDDFARLYVFSDGVYEIKKPAGAMLTYYEFVQLLGVPAGHPRGIDEIVSSVCALQGSEHFVDDFSLLEINFSEKSD